MRKVFSADERIENISFYSFIRVNEELHEESSQFQFRMKRTDGFLIRDDDNSILRSIFSNPNFPVKRSEDANTLHISLGSIEERKQQGEFAEQVLGNSFHQPSEE